MCIRDRFYRSRFSQDTQGIGLGLPLAKACLLYTSILTLQEYLGYLLIPSTKAQKMLVMTGKGGEGKSRIGLLLKKLFGEEMCIRDSFQGAFAGRTLFLL